MAYTIKLVNAEGWKMEKDFENMDEFIITLVNANIQNKRGYKKVVTDIDGNVVTIKSVKKDAEE